MNNSFDINSSICSRVHISEKTLSFLNGEFGVEAAFGEKREESLRIAGLKTYFITNIIKPVSGSNVLMFCVLILSLSCNVHDLFTSCK